MATTMRGGGVGGKEKRGTSPSTSTIKKSPKSLSSTPTSSSSSPSKQKTCSPIDNKPVPNYLKHTLSSTRVPKRTNTLESTTPKPALNRRRSFDRPPPPAQVQKAIRGVPGPRDVKPFRSSSFSNKTSTITPSASLKRPSAKKSTLSNTPVFKKDYAINGTSSTKKKAPKSVTSDSSIDYEDDLVNIDSEVQSLPEISEMSVSSKELGDPTNIEMEIMKQDVSLEEDDHHQEDKSPISDEVPDEPATQEIRTHDQKEDQTVDKIPDQESVEESVDHQNQTEEDAGDHRGGDDDQEVPKVGPSETLVEEEEEEEDESPEKVIEETETKEEKQDVIPPVPVKSQPAGKKENQAYNDVIEETASKLMSRKNKVLALAGAFETVISLQDTSKN